MAQSRVPSIDFFPSITSPFEKEIRSRFSAETTSGSLKQAGYLIIAEPSAILIEILARYTALLLPYPEVSSGYVCPGLGIKSEPWTDSRNESL
jgi:hypothetical protein